MLGDQVHNPIVFLRDGSARKKRVGQEHERTSLVHAPLMATVIAAETNGARNREGEKLGKEKEKEEKEKRKRNRRKRAALERAETRQARLGFEWLAPIFK